MSIFTSKDQVDHLHRLTRTCENAGHISCQNEDYCRALQEEVGIVRQQIEAAARYDNFVPYQLLQKTEPNVTWPVAALVRCLKTLIVQPPWGEDAFRRSVWLTSAFARLGEKGLYVDAVLRTCLAPLLKRRLAVHIGTAWHTGRTMALALESVPSELRPWLSKFEEVTGLAGSGRIPPLEEVVLRASTGNFGRLIDDWIANTATSHVIAWRLDDALAVEVLPTDVVLGGGATATLWVFDRYSETYLDDWHSESLSWELSYAQSPELTARRAGIPLNVLEERPTAMLLAMEAIVRRHTGTGDVLSSSAFAGVDVREIQDQIVFLATAGDIKQAQDLARAAMEKTPHQLGLRNAFAFTLIPSDPSTARTHLEQNPTDRFLKELNLLSCLLAEGNIDQALVNARTLQCEPAKPIRAWLWSPAYLLKKPNVTIIQYYESSEWLADLEAATAK